MSVELELGSERIDRWRGEKILIIGADDGENGLTWEKEVQGRETLQSVLRESFIV